ncbi:MAG: hypothetical protein H0U86_07560 [Chloroflexi bacterium]|nr:hypothetical protein [Chloroflexota bacterium]
MRRHQVSTLALATVLAAGGCAGGQQISQPAVESLPVAAESERVDLTMPAFSNPTDITNPLFPVSRQASVLLVGTVDDLPFRTEVTLLPVPRIIEWEGKQVATLVSQYVAFLDGRLHEVAYDFYAQADDGSVWYFGEDVFNFADGAIVDTHGTWIAGTDGQAAMIMPADPQVGVVYRPENIPGFVFEEVTVTAVDEPLDGPFGPIEGGLLIEELHMDGAIEEKYFAPGYGEFSTSGGGDTEALALAVPTDAVDEPVPEALATLEAGALDVLGAVEAEEWEAASGSVDEVTAAWDGIATGDVPALIGPLMTDALATLVDSVSAEDGAAAHHAIEVARLSLDLQLRHRPVADVDLARSGLWAAQVRLDANAEDAAAVNGDLFALDYVRDRILQTLDAADATRINVMLEEIQGLVNDGDLPAVADAAAELRDVVTELTEG